ncbi:MAG: adenylate/guanylate cyclase domain-containing protein [Treponema sp.]|jgi:adenylate cyclase|nr:adenylate/guanylate cyclase domain-containing protein [Treponema sp.]
MKGKAAKSRKAPAVWIIAVSLSLVTLAGYLSGAFDYAEYKLYDLRINLFAAAAPPSDEIVVILIDQDSIDWAQKNRGWSWPWPRKAYGEIVDYLNLGNAKSIAFDMIFSEPSVHGAEDDAAFARSSNNFGRVVQTVFFSSQTGTDTSWPAGPDKPFFNPENFESILGNYDLANRKGQAKAQFPIPSLRNSAGAIGNITGIADSDGIFRRSDLFVVFDGKASPGLSSASLLLDGYSRDLRYDPQKKEIRWGDYPVPVDKNGRCLLRFRGPLDVYHPYWAWQVLESSEAAALGKEPLLFPEDFDGKYVFFGVYAAGLFDIVSTPVSSVYPGVGMHITLLDNFLKRDFIRESHAAINIILVIAPVFLIVLLVLFSNRIPLIVGGTALVFVLLAGLGLGTFRLAGLWVPLAAPLTAAALAFIITTVYSYATEGHQKRFIKSAFSRYLAPSVIEQILADPSMLNLGGEKRNMTAIFTDIQRFSSISEALQKEYEDNGPKMLVNLLNLYLTKMSDIVLDLGGTIDKYEGDAIIAFFGAPVWTAEHASLACRSAVKMKQCEKELVKEVMDPGGPFYKPLNSLIEKGVIRAGRPLYTRLGINSGPMVVGNMGTPKKMDYTIMGNAVNLAARLEGVNKQYNTSGILISEYTKEKIGADFIVRPLSRVRVVGISTPLRLYELLGLKEELPGDTLDMVSSWENGLKAYEEMDFSGAKHIFSAIHRKDENDGTAKLYIERCDKHTASPPPPEKWDEGVDNLTEK